MDRRNTIKSLIEGLTSEQKQLLDGVLQSEEGKIHMKLPRGIIDEIEALVREIVLTPKAK